MEAIDEYARRIEQARSAGFEGLAIATAQWIEEAGEAARDALVSERDAWLELSLPAVFVPERTGPDDISMSAGRPWRAGDQAEFLAAHTANLAALRSAAVG